eukprot:CAMPEP_0115890216 /NCGR_PEP_ID=MMETSP0287-20121206/33233_1 /TAXON_ID=412157 /ORGANISM="Chrysochromulina rotalis, Strain UIO044" /LENGTH=302 /DNA_ID=CAMNT_0003346973 /DNA_START=44 /DNA_END=952 /DNA_ORIENTATION=+
MPAYSPRLTTLLPKRCPELCILTFKVQSLRALYSCRRLRRVESRAKACLVILHSLRLWSQPPHQAGDRALRQQVALGRGVPHLKAARFGGHLAMLALARSKVEPACSVERAEPKQILAVEARSPQGKDLSGGVGRVEAKPRRLPRNDDCVRRRGDQHERLEPLQPLSVRPVGHLELIVDVGEEGRLLSVELKPKGVTPVIGERERSLQRFAVPDGTSELVQIHHRRRGQLRPIRLPIWAAKLACLRADPTHERMHLVVALHEGTRKEATLRVANHIEAIAQSHVGLQLGCELLELPLHRLRQ